MSGRSFGCFVSEQTASTKWNNGSSSNSRRNRRLRWQRTTANGAYQKRQGFRVVGSTLVGRPRNIRLTMVGLVCNDSGPSQSRYQAVLCSRVVPIWAIESFSTFYLLYADKVDEHRWRPTYFSASKVASQLHREGWARYFFLLSPERQRLQAT